MGSLRSIFKLIGEGGRRVAAAGPGGPSAGRRLGSMAAFLGVGLGTSSYIQNSSENMKAYYGESRYNSMYGGTADALSGAAALGGIWYAGWATLGRDPISKGITTAKYLGARAKVARMPKGSGGSWAGGKPKRQAIRNMVNLGQMPKLGFRNIAGYAAMAGLMGTSPVESYLAGVTVDHLLGPNRGLSKGINMITKKRPGKAINTKNEIKRKSSAIGKGLMGFAGTAAVAGAGSYVGYQVGSNNNNNIAEGNITSFETYNESGVSRMNFSTAGIGLAIHNNRRKF